MGDGEGGMQGVRGDLARELLPEPQRGGWEDVSSRRPRIWRAWKCDRAWVPGGRQWASDAGGARVSWG